MSSWIIKERFCLERNLKHIFYAKYVRQINSSDIIMVLEHRLENGKILSIMIHWPSEFLRNTENEVNSSIKCLLDFKVHEIEQNESFKESPALESYKIPTKCIKVTTKVTTSSHSWFILG